MSELVVGSLKGLSANNFVIDVATGSKIKQTGGILQVVTATKTDTFTTSSTSYVDVTGLSVTITPLATTSKILILVQLAMSPPNNSGATHFQLAGGNTSGFVGDAASNRVRSIGSLRSASDTRFDTSMPTLTATFLDSPNTTSATTYKVQIRTNGATGVVNRSGNDTDANDFGRGASSITVMEVAG